MTRNSIDMMARRVRRVSGVGDDEEERLIRLECLADWRGDENFVCIAWPGPRLPWECKICSI